MSATSEDNPPAQRAGWLAQRRTDGAGQSGDLWTDRGSYVLFEISRLRLNSRMWIVGRTGM